MRAAGDVETHPKRRWPETRASRPAIAEAGSIAESANHDTADRQFAFSRMIRRASPRGREGRRWRTWAAGSL